jgi:uncharacterized protein
LQPDFFGNLDMNVIWFDHLLFFVVGIVLPIMSIMTEKPTIDAESGDEILLSKSNLPPKKHIYYTNGLILVIGALIVLTLWNVTFRSFEVLGIISPHIDTLVLALCGAIVLIYSIDTIVNFIKSKKTTDDTNDLSNIMPTSWSDYGHFIFLAIAAGICEEIVFRGFLINYINQMLSDSSFGYFIALIVPAIIFSVSHIYQGWFAVLKIFAISLLFGAVFIFSKSLLLVCLIHVLVDLISGAVMVAVYRKSDK